MTVPSEADNKEIEKNTEKDEKEEPDEVCAPEEHHDKFDPSQYLESFYKTAKEDTAMQIVLFFLPGMLYRLPERVRTVLDLGAGPTVYLPIALRNRADIIYTSDYAPANRQFLLNWVENRSQFNWSNVCEWISNIEASNETPAIMQQKARDKIAGIFEVNVHELPVIKNTFWKKDGSVAVPKKFQVVTTVFCLEYSCDSLEGYNRAVKGACSLIEDGGFLIQGGVLDATTYSFGGTVFKCHRLLKNHILASLKLNGMATEESDGFKFITHDEIFLLVSKKTKL
ncbi:unnamed protein product [Auanema sp. JU1783]|nr:unnamed protein product [Auanema sp. JU1783]